MTPNLVPMLEVAELRAGYEENLVLDGVSVIVPRDSVVSIVGPNGSGKSTLLKAIYGLVKIRGGRVTLSVDGKARDITGRKPHEITALGVNFVPQLDNVFPRLSVRENLQIGTGAAPDAKRGLPDQILDAFPFLKDVRDRPAGSLSGGQRQGLALARALMSLPKLLFLDEPTAGLAPQLVDDLFDRLQQIRSTGVVIVMVEQNARRALAISDYGYVLEGGQNRYEGPGESLLHDDRVTELYLGKRSEQRGHRAGRMGGGLRKDG